MEKIKEFWDKNIFNKIVTICFTLIIIGILGSIFDNTESNNNNKTKVESKPEVSIVDFSNMEINDIATWCEKNKVECYTKEEYSDTIAKGSFVSQNVKSGDKIDYDKNITIVYSLGKEPSQEYKNALSKAVTYSENMYMSKKAIYNQLISQYGEQFPKDAAQYAIDNVVADWNINALQKAKTYQETMHMSKKAIYDQLISQYGEQFTKTEAQYAIDHLGN